MSANILLDQMMTSQRSSADAMTYIEDVFSSWIFEGNGSTQSIVSGMDFSDKGGLCWIKNRDATDSHILTDTERGAGEILSSDTTTTETTDTDTVTAFNSDGFSLGADIKVNTNGESYIAWQFLEQARFFYKEEVAKASSADKIVDLSSLVDVGMVFVKRTDSTGSWYVWHKELTAGKLLYLEQVAAEATLGHITMSGTTLTLEDGVIADGDYIVYAWADDPNGEAEDGSGLIACGSYEGNGSADGPEIDLGWEVQWVLVKSTASSQNWTILDCIRGMTYDSGGSSGDRIIHPNLSNKEAGTNGYIAPIPSGFKVDGSDAAVNSNGVDYIYMAIRRPMKTPESSSECFAIDAGSSAGPAFDSSFPVDMAFYKDKADTAHWPLSARLMQGEYLQTGLTSAQLAYVAFEFDFMDGWYSGVMNTNDISYMWKRASQFMDVVCYTGDSQAGRIVEHNLQVVPEMMWVKGRSNTGAWYVYNATDGATKHLVLNTTAALNTATFPFNDTNPTSEVFSLGNDTTTNGNSRTYIALLFATLPGISKCGSYTGNGSTQNLDMGFASGAKMVIFKATSTTGNWVIVDSERGIVSGNDPYLLLNSPAVEDTDEDCVDSYAAGITINETTAANINTNGVDYIYYSISN